MKPVLYAVFSLVLACFTAPVARSEDNKLPDDARDVLMKAGQLELLSLHPESEKEKTKDGFHGYKVLGKTSPKDAARKELVQAFLKGMDGKIDAKKCFEPRHGIRATHDGKTVELVICFECSLFYVYTGSAERGQLLLVGRTPEPLFDNLLKDAGIPKAK